MNLDTWTLEELEEYRRFLNSEIERINYNYEVTAPAMASKLASVIVELMRRKGTHVL